jgi:hypothetical protein
MMEFLPPSTTELPRDAERAYDQANAGQVRESANPFSRLVHWWFGPEGWKRTEVEDDFVLA